MIKVAIVDDQIIEAYMKKAKKILLILLSTILTIGGSSCRTNNIKNETVQKEEHTLNEWQKEFLEEQNLPTEYSELNLTQQLSVDAIYEMIMYLEDKYGIEFEYSGYARPQILEKEHMTAIPKGGNEKTDTVTVTREDDGTLTDDYPNVAVRPYYEQMITDYVKEYFNSDKIKVLSTVTEASLESVENIDNEKLEGNISATNVIFIHSDICSEDMLAKFAADYTEWMKEHNFVSTNRINIVFNVDISNINYSNLSDYYNKEYLKYDLLCYVKLNGEIIINK